MLKIALDLFYISLNFNFTFNTFKIWSKSGTLTAMSANILQISVDTTLFTIGLELHNVI